MIRWTAAPALVVALACLTACSSSSTPASTAPASAPLTASAPSTPTGATGIPASTGSSAATSVGSYPAAEVCAFIQGQLPKLKAIGTTVGAEADITVSLFGFFQDHGIAPDGTQLEGATKAQCPDVHAELLKVTGLTSLAQI